MKKKLSKKIDNNDFLILPYIFETKNLKDLFFDGHQISIEVIEAMNSQIMKLSLSKSELFNIIDSGGNHPIFAFRRVYGEKFEQKIVSHLI